MIQINLLLSAFAFQQPTMLSKLNGSNVFRVLKKINAEFNFCQRVSCYLFKNETLVRALHSSF